MRKLLFGCSWMFFGLMLMAAPGAVPGGLVEKTYTGRIQFLEQDVKGHKTSGYYIVSGENQIQLPKAKANMDLKQYVGKDVTVVIKGSMKKVKVKKSTENRFTGVEIVSIKIKAADAAEENEAEEE